MICNKLDKDESLIEYVADRKGHDFRYATDSSKIKKELGWSPETDFYEGMDCTIKWYIQNQDWLKEILGGEHKNSD